MGLCMNRPLAPPPRQAKPHACLFESLDGGVAAFTQLRLNERSTEGESSSGIVSGIRRLMQWNEYTGSMSIDELNLLTREGFVGKVGWIFEATDKDS